jgi:hypothetical protein
MVYDYLRPFFRTTQNDILLRMDDVLVLGSSGGKTHIVIIKSEGGNKLPDNGEGTHKAFIMQTIEMEESQGKIKSHLPCFAIYASVDGKWFLTARNSADGDGHISLFSEMHLMLHCIDFGGPCQLLKYQFQLPPFLHKEHVRIHRRHSSWLLRALTMQCMSLMSMGDA